jgi:hypothetical protein
MSSGVALNELDFDDLFDKLDADRTGKITYTEWLAASIPKPLITEMIRNRNSK